MLCDAFVILLSQCVARSRSRFRKLERVNLQLLCGNARPCEQASLLWIRRCHVLVMFSDLAIVKACHSDLAQM